MQALPLGGLMNAVDWNIVSAIANVVMAATAVIAAWYALRQYRSSLRLQEMEQITSMYQATADVMRQVEGKEFDHATMRDALNLLETHERLIANGLLTKRATEFYRDAISINDEFGNIPLKNLRLIRDVLERDKRGYRHLIAALRGREETKYIIDW